jgi:hypothetical protein
VRERTKVSKANVKLHETKEKQEKSIVHQAHHHYQDCTLHHATRVMGSRHDTQRHLRLGILAHDTAHDCCNGNTSDFHGEDDKGRYLVLLRIGLLRTSGVPLDCDIELSVGVQR